VPERTNMAKAAGAHVLDFMKEDVYERIQDLTSGRGADACIDAVVPNLIRRPASTQSSTV